MLNCPPTSSCGLLTGSSAIAPFWLARADSSFSACDELDPAGLVGFGAVPRDLIAGVAGRGLAGQAPWLAQG